MLPDPEEPAQIISTARDDNSIRFDEWAALKTVLTYTPDFLYSFDLQGRFTFVNQALLSLWQKPASEALGKNFFDLGYPAELAERLASQIRLVIESGLTVRDRTPYTGPDGETRHYEYIFVPVLGENRKPGAVVGSTRDITEQEKAVSQQLDSEERLAFALEAGGGIGTWDWIISKDLVYCNERFAQLFSVDAAKASTRSANLRFHQKHAFGRPPASDGSD